MKKIKGLNVLLFILVLGSCELATIEPVSDIPDDLSLSSDIQPIFDANCISCHGGSYEPDLRTGQSYSSLLTGGYVDTDNPGNSKLYKVFDGSHSSRASNKEKAYILGWIEQGAKDN